MTSKISPPAPLGLAIPSQTASNQPALFNGASKASSPVSGKRTNATLKSSDQFSSLTFGSGKSKPKPVQFGNNSEKGVVEKAWNVVKKTGAALGLGTLGLTSAVVCWPLALGAGVLGLFIHPLLAVSALLGLAPFILAGVGGYFGAKV